jgi:hypothetical protein
MENFKIKTYGKSELALLYFPQSQTTEGALRCLNFWINGNEQLQKELQACGMPRTSKSYTPREVALIVAYLGEP